MFFYFILGRTDYVIALALAKDIISNWRPVPRPKPDSQDEVDASRVKRMLVCAEYKGTIHILRKHFIAQNLICIPNLDTKTRFFRQNKRISFSTLHFYAVV